jgi:asparagine synthase (glutamine-hydrolysing)
MCGIAGIMRFDGAPPSAAALDAMATALGHRGPDGSGTWIDGAVGLAHTRLAIIDPAGSAQPLESRGGDLHLVVNGEILNYRELRAGLRYPFQTSGDGEVILALHSSDARGVPARLVGQFAYALHDRRTKTLTLVRDRLGILPLYWWAGPDRVVFASELAALAIGMPVPLAVDELAVVDHLTRRSVPSPHTLCLGVQKVRPGHELRIRADGAVEEVPYWHVPSVSSSTVAPQEAVARVGAALSRAVERNLVADVPVGAYLSGGLDSSLIVAMVRHQRGPDATIQTFAAGFGDHAADELPYARSVARALSTEHHEVQVRPTDFEALWAPLTRHRGAPLSEPADVAVFRLAETAREHVKVVLSGEGGDELFAGYPKYRWAKRTEMMGRVPASIRGPVLDFVQRSLPAGATRPRVLLRAAAERSAAERMDGWFAPFTSRDRRRLLGRSDGHGQPEVVQRADGDVIDRMLFADCHAWLSDNLLERGDRMTMAASVELRPPMLDHELVELACGLPHEVKVRAGVGKWALREVGRHLLPAEIVSRRKVGFSVPLDEWFRGHLEPMARDLLLGPDSFVSQLADRASITMLLDDHRRGRRDEAIRIWTLLGLEVWHGELVRGQAASVDAA